MADNKIIVGGGVGGVGSVGGVGGVGGGVGGEASAPPPVSITKETINRLLKDIRDMVTSSLENDGIFYKHSETNILKAYVMIVGPPDSL